MGTNPWRHLRKSISEDRKAGAKILRQELAWYVQGINKEANVLGRKNPKGREWSKMKLENKEGAGLDHIGPLRPL